MEPIIKSIKKSIECQNYYSALFLALSLPDICGAIETPDEKNGVRYKRWFRENLKKYYFPDNMYEFYLANAPQALKEMDEHRINDLKLRAVGQLAFTDEMCWKLRNAVVHTGTKEVKGHKFHFSHTMADRNIIGDTLQMSAVVFCNNFCFAYGDWLDKVKDDVLIGERLKEGMDVQNHMLGGVIRFE